MTEIIIFGGTSEGRKLAEVCGERGIPAAVSVVTEYGAELLPDSPSVEVHTGPMDLEEMTGWLKEKQPSLVLDATHPYAAQATEHIRKACKACGIPLLRVLREEIKKEDGPREKDSGEEKRPRIVTVETVRQAAEYLAGQPGRILVTTGSKELEEFTALEDYKERVYARVLPASFVLAGCEAKGFPGSHIYARQGPFSAEMNLAMLRMSGASWLVTKEAGRAGGFEEKLRAAEAAGAGVVIVGRPKKEEGISLKEALEVLAGLTPENRPFREPPESGASEEGACRAVLTLAGAGMGTAESMTVEAVEALLEAQAVFGAPRMLQAAEEVLARFGGKNRPEMKGEYLPGPVFEWLRSHGECRRAVVLFSGDTGFYSGTAGFLKEAGADSGWEIRVLPGISSLSCMAAALKKSWEDAVIASRHGRDWDVRALAERNRKVFVLTGGDCRAQQICGELAGLPVIVYVGENLGSGRERILKGKPEELAKESFASLAVMWIEKEES